MSEVARRRMNADEFFAWQAEVEIRHELVDGMPVAMAGANLLHDRIVTNTLVAITLALRAGGSGCTPFSADAAVAIPSGNIRYPDLGVYCGPFQETSMTAIEPRLVIEVLSPSTACFDEHQKLAEYRTVPSIVTVLLVDYLRPRVLVHLRKASGSWVSRTVEGLDGLVDVPDLGFSLPLSEVYRNLTFRPRPEPVPLPDPGE